MMRTLDLNALPEGTACTFARWTYRNQDTGESEAHTHSFHEMFWVEAGEGIEWVNHSRRPLRPGLLVLVKAEDTHMFSSAGGDNSVCFVNFGFPRKIWENIRERGSGLAGNYFDRAEWRERAYLLSVDEMERLRVLSHDLQSGNRDAFTADTFLAGVITLLENRNKTRPRSALPDWLAIACEQIRLFPHFTDGTAAFFRLAGRSQEHVSRELRRYMGITPTELVSRVRLEHVAQQLVTSNREILDIAYEAGFENVGHFYERFKSVFKTTPRHFRLENSKVSHGVVLGRQRRNRRG